VRRVFVGVLICTSAACLETPPFKGSDAYPVVVEAGGQHTCVRTSDGNLYCWGSGTEGHLGHADPQNIGDNERVVAKGPVPIGAPVDQMSSQALHTCAIAGAQLYCWGSDADGQLGLTSVSGTSAGQTPMSLGPVPLPGAAVPTKVAAGACMSCAVADGDVVCWGCNDHSQLGNGGTDAIDDASVATPVGGLPEGPIDALAAGGSHTCALMSGRLFCWGSNILGQLGVGDTVDRSSATEVFFAGTVKAVSAGDSQTCAIIGDGELYCWGFGESGRLASGDVVRIEVADNGGPIDLDGRAAMVSCGHEHTCVVLEDGRLQCWGNGGDGRLGTGATDNRGDEPGEALPILDFGEPVVSVGAATRHTCVVLESGRLLCWGYGAGGRLGDGSVADRLDAMQAAEVTYQ